MPQFRPSTPDGVVAECVARIGAVAGPCVVAVDAHPVAEPDALARRVAGELRDRGRPAGVVRVVDFIRPASVRMEFGRTDPQSYQESWYDYAALDREVVGAVRAHGRWLPRLWDADTDRSFRDRARPAEPGQVVLVAGPMLLGRGLRFDLTVALIMSARAIDRGTDDEHRWQTAPFVGYQDGVADVADLVVRWEHPERPAIAV